MRKINKRAQRFAPLRSATRSAARSAARSACALARALRSARAAQRNASTPMQTTSYYHHPTTHSPAPPPLCAGDLEATTATAHGDELRRDDGGAENHLGGYVMNTAPAVDLTGTVREASEST